MNIRDIYKKLYTSDTDSEIIQYIEYVKCNDPEFDINLGDENNWTLLMIAVRVRWYNREELVRYLLTYPNIDVNHRSNYNSTVLHFCEQVSILKLLLTRKDLDVNIQNSWGETELYLACRWGRKAWVKELLLDARVNLMIRDGGGRTARDIALRNKDYNIAKIVENSGYTPLLRIPNRALLHDIVRMIIEEYT